jgi:hypothetical protein
VIGEDAARDRERFHVTEQGVVLVTQDMLRAVAAHPAAQSLVAPTDAGR